jgi:mannose-1-phosphate guanylyltransferase / phosphomannomutase
LLVTSRSHPEPPLGVILTGGRATRLRPLSNFLPKSLIPLLNRPLIDYSIEMLA